MISKARRARGAAAYLAGVTAERTVLRAYERKGYALQCERWRGKAGEIDLILEKDGCIVFVEVKQAQSFAQAAERIQPRQQVRLLKAAEEYVADMPSGSLSEMRFDAAFVNGVGQVKVIANALAA